MDFIKENKRIGISVLVLLIAATGYYFYKVDEKQDLCLDKVVYEKDPASGSERYTMRWINDLGKVSERSFKTKKEGMEYCMEVF